MGGHCLFLQHRIIQGFDIALMPSLVMLLGVLAVMQEELRSLCAVVKLCSHVRLSVHECLKIVGAAPHACAIATITVCVKRRDRLVCFDVIGSQRHYIARHKK